MNLAEHNDLNRNGHQTLRSSRQQSNLQQSHIPRQQHRNAFSRWVLWSRHPHSVLSYIPCVFSTRTSYCTVWQFSTQPYFCSWTQGYLRVSHCSHPHALATLVPVYISVHLLHTRSPISNFGPTFGRVWGSFTCTTVLHPGDRVHAGSLQGPILDCNFLLVI